jgi:hypothetical protein
MVARPAVGRLRKGGRRVSSSTSAPDPWSVVTSTHVRSRAARTLVPVTQRVRDALTARGIVTAAELDAAFADFATRGRRATVRCRRTQA